MGHERIVRARRIVQVEAPTNIAASQRRHQDGFTRKRRGTHDWEDECKAVTDAESVIFESVRQACGILFSRKIFEYKFSLEP